MLNKLTLLLLFCSFCISASAQKLPSYQLFTAKGKKVHYQKLIQKIQKADVVLFGELHNNAIAHWLQLEVAKSLNNTQQLSIGMEMLERDNQLAINRFLTSEINTKALDTVARLWPNYDTDYAPIVAFAKSNNINIIASNIPRSYANLVYKGDFAALDTLSEKEKKWIAPLPIPFNANLTTYQNILKMMGEHGSPKLVKAQAIKDATMAYSIIENLKPNALFYHLNGSFHSDYHEGISWYLKHYKPEITIKTITTVTQKNLKKLDSEHLNKADFILCVDEDVTNTY